MKSVLRAAVGGAVAVASAIALAACSGGGGGVGGGAPPSSIAPEIQVTGAAIPYDGLQAWTLASIPSRSSTELTVFATGSDTGGGPCGPPVLRLSAAETATEVRVAVAAYQQPAAPDTACPAIGYVPGPNAVRLQAPLGDRRLVDARSGKAPRLLVGSDYPDIPNPPVPFTTAVLGSWDPSGPVTRTWSATDDATLSLQVEHPAAVREIGPYGEIVRTVDIGGSTATLYRTGDGRYTQRTVQWTPNGDQTITVRLDAGERRRWSDDEAIAVARSVTGYATSDTGRLPVPSTPGTAAAVYSSADGPVEHAPNLLKSSGVYLGVSCQGAGSVHVGLRGTDFRFRCGDDLRQLVQKSVGDPFQQFFLDVSADPGVRWTLVLARASLDGS